MEERHIVKSFFSVSVLFSSLILVACDGTGETESSLNGLYSDEVSGGRAVIYDNQLIAFSSDSMNETFVAEQINQTSSLFAADLNVFLNTGLKAAELNMEAYLEGVLVVEYEDKDSVTNTPYPSGSIIMNTVSDLYFAGSSPTLITANWSGTNGAAAATSVNTSVSLDDQGALTGTNSHGCVLEGTLVPVSTTINLYDAVINYTECTQTELTYPIENGQYAGFAWLEDDGAGGADNVMYITLHKGSFARSVKLFKSLSLKGSGPVGGNVVGGVGTIEQSGSTTIINQNSEGLAINWQSSEVNQDETINFIQPDSPSISLNRILDQSAPEINGAINTDGQVIQVIP